MKETPVVVVGGGITGLSCAYSLSKHAVGFALLEEKERLGGTIRTERLDEFILDTGPDAFLVQKPDALALCREVGLESRLIPTNPDERTVYVWFRGRLHPLPEGMVLTVPSRFLPLALSGLFSPLGKLRMAMDLFVPPLRDGREESIRSFIERRLGREVVERLAEPLLAGIHSGDPERLSMNELFPRFVTLEQRYGSLIRGIRKVRPQESRTSRSTLFMSLAGGLDELVEAVAGRLPEGSIHPGARVLRIRREKETYVVETSAETFVCRAVALCLPVAQSVDLVGELSESLAATLRSHRSVSTAIVFMAFRREEMTHPLDGYGFVVPRTEGLRLTAATFVSTKFPNRSPRSHVLLRTFYGGSRDPDVLELTDDQLIRLAKEELSRVLGELPCAFFSRVYRWPGGTPQVELGHRKWLDAVEGELEHLPGVQLAANGLRGTGIPDCIADGRRAAETVVSYLDRSIGTNSTFRGR